MFRDSLQPPSGIAKSRQNELFDGPGEEGEGDHTVEHIVIGGSGMKNIVNRLVDD